MLIQKFAQALKGLLVTSGSTDEYVIANAEKLRDKDVRSFSIPRSDQRKSLKVGASAKILIEAKKPTGSFAGERPWVVVTEVVGSKYKVKVDNSLALFQSLNDAELMIGPENIIAVTLPNEYRLPYGKTCLVSAGVWEQDQWPSNAIRDELPPNEGQSGWRIFSKNESPSAAQLSVPFEMLMAKHQVLDTILDEPGASCWAWNSSENEFKASPQAVRE